MSEHLCFNQSVHVYPFDGASQRPMFVCEVLGEDASVVARLLLPTEVVEFLKQFDGTQETATLIQRYVKTHPQYTAEKVASLNQYCLRKGLLVHPGTEQTGPVEAPRRRGYLYLRVPLFPPKLVSAISTPLTWLFEWKVLFFLLPLFILAQAYFFIRIMPGYHFSLNSLQGFDFFLVTLLTSLLGLFHELGHAAALNHYGFRRAEIGWGLYISFAVFYTDLSDCWKLKRKQRAMVDLGGVYFHCITLLGILGLILWKHNPLLVYCFFFADVQIAAALNPFLRNDGYWLVGDIFGIADLNKRILKGLEHWVNRLLRIPQAAGHPFSELTTRSRRFLYVYLVAVVAFAIFLIKILVVQILFGLVPGYPSLLVKFWGMLTSSPRSVVGLLDIGSGLLWKGLVIYGFLRLIYNTFIGVMLWLARIWRAAHPAARSSVTGEPNEYHRV